MTAPSSPHSAWPRRAVRATASLAPWLALVAFTVVTALAPLPPPAAADECVPVAAAETTASTAEGAGAPTRQAPAPLPAGVDHGRGSAAAPARDPVEPPGKLDLNLASADELVRLPGVGPAKAGAVLEWRARRGPFRRVRDLRRVAGFGPRTVARLEHLVTVSRPTTLTKGATPETALESSPAAAPVPSRTPPSGSPNTPDRQAR